MAGFPVEAAETFSDEEMIVASGPQAIEDLVFKEVYGFDIENEYNATAIQMPWYLNCQA
jgi:hypothetical protein